MEYALWHNHRVPVVEKTFAELAKEATWSKSPEWALLFEKEVKETMVLNRSLSQVEAFWICLGSCIVNWPKLFVLVLQPSFQKPARQNPSKRPSSSPINHPSKNLFQPKLVYLLESNQNQTTNQKPKHPTTKTSLSAVGQLATLSAFRGTAAARRSPLFGPARNLSGLLEGRLRTGGPQVGGGGLGKADEH